MADYERQLIEKLESQQASIDKICRIAGVAGASIGVIHGGEIVYTNHHGFADPEQKQKADSSTLYGIGSCSKSFFAVAVANAIVDKKTVEWDEPVRRHLPEFITSSTMVTDNANLVDIAAHRMGLSGAFHLTFQGDGEHLIKKDDFWKYLPKLRPVVPFRASWLYNSHGYSVLGQLLEKVTGKSLQECLDEYVSKPLGLKRTISKLEFDTTPNFAKPHAALADGSLHPLKYRHDFRNHFFEAAAGIYTSLEDMLTYSKHVLRAASELPPKEHGPIREAGEHYSAHIPIMTPSIRERSYGLGWIRTQLPGAVGLIGDNSRIAAVQDLPILGEGASSKLALYHQGATVGYFTSFYLFPETQSGVIVLTNSIANCDAADFIAQSLIQSLFSDEQKLDFVQLTERFCSRCLGFYDQMQQTVETKRQKSPPPRHLAEYTGEYYDDTGLFFIGITCDPESKEQLKLAFQGLDRHTYSLRYFYDETFEWTLTRDETAKRGRYHQFDQRYFNFCFNELNGQVVSLSWHHDRNVQQPEVFKKSEM
ncbi:beta-lactamase/transpeptidase-like protein [Pseudovirgaria hyperparasitica]|uniref:Beta-lactamase/transpeptidase-like protein n=1 Tax=Pseudovirgaria hyperparasitica TaxID=470096 RepID=A0A6A6W8Y1_9PEZI|nr:beta-lactamase/transpeptidase-like protein [Pseudovirgaria hyperparasitica]KAF2758047.1 beta-lactamase/transpeptidase-like protein [Pseudovirgaria hyperparasitica]